MYLLVLIVAGICMILKLKNHGVEAIKHGKPVLHYE